MTIGEKIIDEIIRQDMVQIDEGCDNQLVWSGNAPEQLEAIIFELRPNDVAMRDAINGAWESAYPGSVPVTDSRALCHRVKQLAEERLVLLRGKNGTSLQSAQ